MTDGEALDVGEEDLDEFEEWALIEDKEDEN